jgi:hypothetical protein
MYAIENRHKIVELMHGFTAHGISNLSKSKRIFNKIYWLFFLFASGITCFYYVFNEINEYFNYEVVTVIKSVYEQPSEFPTITFCLLETSHLNEFNLSKAKQIKFGFDYSIGSDPVNHFESFNSQDMGKCYRFNSGKNMKNDLIPIKYSTIGGRDDSFLIKMNAEFSLTVWIHNRASSPRIQFQNNHDDPVFVSSATSAYLAVEKTVDMKMGEPYNECLKNVTAFQRNKTIIDYILKINESYSQAKCFQFCFDLTYIHQNPCDCPNATIGNIWLDCWINNEQKKISSCTYKFKTEFFMHSLKQMCSEYCPLECDSTSYSYSVRSYGSTDNSTSLIVYLTSLKYTLITQHPQMYTFDLISSIGGTLGIFIGLSFVNLFEVFEIVIEIVILFNKRSNSKKTQKQRILSESSTHTTEKDKLDLFPIPNPNNEQFSNQQLQIADLLNECIQIKSCIEKHLIIIKNMPFSNINVKEQTELCNTYDTYDTDEIKLRKTLIINEDNCKIDEIKSACDLDEKIFK